MHSFKKIFISFITLLFVTVGLAGCGQQAASKASKTKNAATITLTINHKQTAKKRVVVAKKETVMKALKANFKVKASKGFITSIDGHAQNLKKQQYWLYSVNGKSAAKGAAATTIHKGDKVAFTLNPSK